MTGSLPILYSFRRCPYAMRARMAIVSSGQTCALRELLLRNKPAEMLEASPKGTVPVLVLPDGQVIDESYDVMRWALGRNDPAGWLKPSHGGTEEMEALIAVNDGPFKHHLDRYKYPTRYEDTDPHHHRSEGALILDGLEQRLTHSAFLFGDQMSLADAAIAPFVRQFAHTDRDWFDGLALPRVQAWLKVMLESSVFQTVMTKFPVWEAGMAEPEFPPSEVSDDR